MLTLSFTQRALRLRQEAHAHLCAIFTFACKTKKSPNFEGDGAKHHVKYDKNGLVKKKGATPQRTWDNY